MVTKKGVVVHPWYKGSHEWKVNGIAEGPQPIHYDDSHQGKVAYAPKILLLGSERLKRVLWFTYWIATSNTGGKLKWGQGSPIFEEDTLLNLLKQAIEKGFFSEKFLTELHRELGKALKSADVALSNQFGNTNVLVLDAKFVQKWRDRYDGIFEGSYDQNEENAIRDWLSKQGEPKYLNKEYFVRLGRWKTKRQTSNYKANHESDVIEATRSAYQASDELVKLNMLKRLKGVGVAVAATVLHYLQPNTFPIFDYHARTTLKKAGLWNRSENDASDQAWLEYTRTIRELCSCLDVSLRDLDKALFAYDKYRD